MTRGRCQRRRKMMGRGANGGCGTEEKHCPISSSRVSTKDAAAVGIGLRVGRGIDVYAQACKALAVLSPFDVEDAQKKSSSSSANIISTLPSGLASCLSKHSDSHRKRHKKSHHSGPEAKKNSKNKSSSSKPRGFSIWSETEDYFRELRVDDIERLKELSCFRDKKFFFITYPSIANDVLNKENSHGRCGGPVANEEVEEEEGVEHFMEVDEVGTNEVPHREQEEKKASSLPQSYSGVEWLLGSQSKIYLTSERPSKKRKLLGGEAGLEKVFVARPVKQEQGQSLLCHYCSLGDMDNQLNRLIVCTSCGVAVHQRCYGVQQDVEAGCWLCSWCRLKGNEGKGAQGHCLLCPQQGGALKPVRKRGIGNDNGSLTEFAHLFCCQWIPEIYLEDTKTMEPIMNIEGIKETRRKLICYLCKVKCGACVRCSNGACRTSFHPICAREARHRMEIWGKFGCDDVELRAFCSKHSEIEKDSSQIEDLSVAVGSDSTITENQPSSSVVVNEPCKLKIGRKNGDKFVLHREAVDTECNKPGDSVASKDGSLDSRSNLNHQLDVIDNQQSEHTSKGERCGAEDVKVSESLNFTLILKKLVDRGKVNLKDVASDIGVSPDLLASDLVDDCLLPDLHCKIVKWLKSHAHIGTLPKNLKLRIKSSSISKAEKESDKDAVKASDKNVGNSVPFKSVPPRMRTKGNIRMLKDNNLILTFKRRVDDDGVVMDEDINGRFVDEDQKFRSEETFPDATEKVSVVACEALRMAGDNAKCPSPSDSGSGQADEPIISDCNTVVKSSVSYCSSAAMDEKPVTIGMEALPGSYVHPLILNKLSLMQNQVFSGIKADDDSGSRAMEVFPMEASSSSGVCCNGQRSTGSSCGVVKELGNVKRMSILDMCPMGEVEGELIYYQQKLLCNAVASRHFNDGLICKVVKCLPQEIDNVGTQNWDAVLVNQYLCELREAKKQGRKEKRHKEAQAVLAAATAAAAASSRLSSFRKDTVDETSHREDLLKWKVLSGRSAHHAQQIPHAKESLPKLAVVRGSPEKNFDSAPSILDCKDNPRVCDICRRPEILLNPIFVCSSCKVAVHIDCYRSVKDTKGPWYCELCEDLLSSRNRGVAALSSLENPSQVVECSLCGGTAGAFRKSTDGQWIHAFCAEWILESTFRRGQVKPVEGLETISRGSDFCLICSRKQGVCIKCNYGHCQSTFHPLCGRSAGFFMNVRSGGGKLQHKAYCEKHSFVERTKAETQKHGFEEWNSLKKVRVELERLRLICERIIKREKLKRELVICSHDILCWNRDSISSSTRASSAFLSPDLSSESATTSLRGCADSYKSCSETIQRSDDITIDSTIASKRRVRFPMPMDPDQKTDDSSTSQLLTQTPTVRAPFAGKQIPHRAISAVSRSTSDDGEKCVRYRKHTETFGKELLMTSDQASMRNQRLPKGFVYVPICRLSNEKETVAAASSEETSGQDG